MLLQLSGPMLCFLLLWSLSVGVYASGIESSFSSSAQGTSVVSISYTELANIFQTPNDENHNNSSEECQNLSGDVSPPDRLLDAISEAFGPQGLGFLEITHLPSRLVQLRQQVLPLAEDLAHLPKEELDEMTLPETFYTIGWSHGKEQFGSEPDGTPIYDTFKGSFYLDPFRPERNVFPSSLDLEAPLLETTRWMTQVALWIAQLCDAYLQKRHPSNTSNDLIYRSLQNKINSKARLLYYFPKEVDQADVTIEKEKENDISKPKDDWCGWHKDHGSLTALLPGLMLDASSSPETELSPSHAAAKAGLYVETREGDWIPIRIPPTSMGIQVGETLEIMSGGKLQATPHAVVSSPGASQARASLAVFLQPEPSQDLPSCPDTADASLRARYRSTFGDFQKATTQAFQ